jgi:sucrose-6-phosphate hydrolase SacC (GH32 family)
MHPSFAGWQFDGFLASGDNTALGLRGTDWECPILARLPHADSLPSLASNLRALDSNSNSSSSAVDYQNAAAAAVLEPSVSQQLLLPKHKRAAAGSSMSSCASASSLLGVGQYPAAAAGCDSDTISSSVSDYSPISEVSSNSSSCVMVQPPYVPLVNSCSCGDVASVSQMPYESVLSTAAAPSTVSSSCGRSGSNGSLVATNSSSSSSVQVSEVDSAAVVPAAAAVADAAVAAVAALPDGLAVVAPLTEPVLAAATAATEAAAAATGSAALFAQQHPSTNLCAWLEQSPEPTQAALAAAAAVAAATVGAEDTLNLATGSSSRGVEDAIVVIDDGYCSSSSPVGKASSSTLQQLAAAAAVPGSSPTSYTTPANTDSSTSSSSSSRDWFFCISPEACNFPITWWLGSYDGRAFDVAAADGPHKLDLGTTLYAATLWEDPQVMIKQAMHGCTLPCLLRRG